VARKDIIINDDDDDDNNNNNNNNNRAFSWYIALFIKETVVTGHECITTMKSRLHFSTSPCSVFVKVA
jgi:hypothetical protein